MRLSHSLDNSENAMGRLQLSIETDGAHIDDLSELLEKFGADSISLAAADDQALQNTPGCNSPEKQETGLWQRTRLMALFPADIDLDIVLLCIRNRIGDEHIYAHSISLLADKDWRDNRSQQQQSIILGDKLCICPSWCDPPEGLSTITLDPGLAFGTGSHPTTSLCLQWLMERDLHNKTVIDYGCGTAILAMVAAKLGASSVYAVDIDPQALRACKNNIEANNLNQQITMVDARQAQLPLADILIANILMGPLIKLAEQFSRLVKPGAYLALSGILHVQSGECMAAYSRWFNMRKPLFNREWALLHGTLPDIRHSA